MLTNQIKYNHFLAFLILFQVVTVFSKQLNNVFLYFILPLLGMIALFIKFKSTFNDKLFNIYFLFNIIYIINTLLFSIDLENSLSNFITFLGYLLFVYVVNSYSSNYKFLKIFLLLYVFYFISILLLGVFKYDFLNIDYTSDRAGGEGLNANRFGYFIFFMTFIFYVYGEISTKRKNIIFFKYLFLLTPVISLLIALITGSRQILIIQIPFILILFLLRYASKIKIQSLLLIIILLSAWILISDSLFDIYNNSLLSGRMGREIEDDARYYLLFLGFEIGFDHFFTGVGLDNFKLFSGGYISHSSFSEAFSEAGFFALIIYVSLLFHFIKLQLRRYVLTKNKIFISFIVFGVFYFLYNFFYVFYEFGLLIAFIFIIEHLSQYVFKYLSSNSL